MTHQLLICDNDKFACQGELIFFYPLENLEQLPTQAINIGENQDGHLYAIRHSDFLANGLRLPNEIVFVGFRELIAYVSSEQANQLSKAMQLLRWRDDHSFCSRCGTKTKTHPRENVTVCPSCHYHQYPRIQPCIITAIVKTGENPQLLLAHHQRAKDSGMYTAIAGFVEVGESLEQCVHREVAEEVGLSVKNLQYVASQPWAYPSNLMIGFIAEYESGEIVIEQDELIHADFFDLDKIDDIKTPSKGTIAHQLIERVKTLYAKISG